jgi:excisionase family DNA binding protein
MKATMTAESRPQTAANGGSPDDAAARLSELGGLLTLTGAAAVLSVPESWLRKRVASHTVPCTRLGRHIRFTRQQIDQIVLAAQQPIVAMPTFGLTRRSRRVS